MTKRFISLGYDPLYAEALAQKTYCNKNPRADKSWCSTIKFTKNLPHSGGIKVRTASNPTKVLSIQYDRQKSDMNLFLFKSPKHMIQYFSEEGDFPDLKFHHVVPFPVRSLQGVYPNYIPAYIKDYGIDYYIITDNDYDYTTDEILARIRRRDF